MKDVCIFGMQKTGKCYYWQECENDKEKCLQSEQSEEIDLEDETSDERLCERGTEGFKN